MPRYFSPVPALVEEMRSLLEPTSDGMLFGGRDLRPNELIQVDVLVALVDLSKTGSLLPADQEYEGEAARGIVKDNDRLLATMGQVERAGCLEIVSRRRMVCTNDNPSAVCTVGGICTVGRRLQAKPQTTVVVQARMGNGDSINLPLVHADYSEPAGVNIRTTSRMQVWYGTCFVYSENRNCKRKSAVSVPLLIDMPGIGPWVRFEREVETDQALLIVATPTVVSSR